MPNLFRRRLWFSAGLATAALLLYFSLRGINWLIVWKTIRSISTIYGTASLAVGIVPMMLRAARWRNLLAAAGQVGYSTTFWAIAAGYFGNNFLPARGGELVRSYIVRDRSRLALSYILATAVSERVADAVALVIFGTIALALLPQAQAWMKPVRGTFVVIGSVGVLGLALLPRFADPVTKMLQPWPRWQRVATQILLGVRSFHNARRLLQFTALTILIWFTDAAATALLAFSLSIPMPISLAMLLIVALSLFSALPSTPGYVGVYQFVAVMLLKPFGINASVAIAFIVVLQALSFAVTGVLGLLAVGWFTPLEIGAIRQRTD